MEERQPQAGIKHLKREDGQHYIVAYDLRVNIQVEKDLPVNFDSLEAAKQQYWMGRAVEAAAKEMRFLINEHLIKNNVPTVKPRLKANRHDKRKMEKQNAKKR